MSEPHCEACTRGRRATPALADLRALAASLAAEVEQHEADARAEGQEPAPLQLDEERTAALRAACVRALEAAGVIVPPPPPSRPRASLLGMTADDNDSA